MIGGAKTKARAADEGGDALLDSLLGEIEQDPMGAAKNPFAKLAAVSSGAATRPAMPNYRPASGAVADAVPRIVGGGAVFGQPSSLGSSRWDEVQLYSRYEWEPCKRFGTPLLVARTDEAARRAQQALSELTPVQFDMEDETEADRGPVFSQQGAVQVCMFRE